MDIQSVRTLLELKAIQNIGSSSKDAANATSSNDSYFTEMLSELLKDNTDVSTELSNMLGSYGSIADSGAAFTSFLNSNEGAAFLTNNPYLASFLYNDSPNNIQSIDQNTVNLTEQVGNGNTLAGAEQYAATISKAAETYQIPEKLITAVMKQESNFNQNAVSSAGATGLMQLMPSTAKYLGLTDSTDPDQNIMGGAKYLRQMLDKFDGNISLALSAYNAGPGNVDKYNGIPPFKETQNYVKNILNYYQS